MAKAGALTARCALPMVTAALSACSPAGAGAVAHRLDPAAGAGFWGASQVRAAIANGAPRRSAAKTAGRAPGAPSTGSGPAAAASSFAVPDVDSAEDRTNGRIFGVDRRSGAYSCSGISLATPSGSIVLTAGHCVLQGGNWGSRLAFVPAYDHGARPFGTFLARAAYVPAPWRRRASPEFDVAALRVAPSAAGSLSQVVGARGYATGSSRFSPQRIYGYPAGRLEGEELRACETRALGGDALAGEAGGPRPVPAACDMTVGASGGAWLLDGELIDGVTGYGYRNQRGLLYSPYFGAELGRFLASLP